MAHLDRLIAEVPLGDMRVSICHDEKFKAEDVVMVAGEAVYDPRLYRYAVESSGPVILVDGGAQIGLEKTGSGKREAGSVEKESGGGLVPVDSLPSYLPNMRRDLRPYWRRLKAREDYLQAERMIMDSAQKGILDFPARYLHPIPEDYLAALLSRTAITPNQITVFTGLLAFVTTYLFAVQSYGWGLAIALVVNVLDGVDGKLARVKLLSSKFGDRLDHVLDVTFEFAWYVALGWGLSQGAGGMLPLYLSFGLIAIMLGTRAVSGAYTATTGRQIHDHTAFDRGFRLVGGRRNVYIIMLLAGLLLGSVGAAFYAVVGWGVVTLAVFKVRAVMAFLGRESGGRD